MKGVQIQTCSRHATDFRRSRAASDLVPSHVAVSSKTSHFHSRFRLPDNHTGYGDIRAQSFDLRYLLREVTTSPRADSSLPLHEFCHLPPQKCSYFDTPGRVLPSPVFLLFSRCFVFSPINRSLGPNPIFGSLFSESTSKCKYFWISAVCPTIMIRANS